MINLSQRFPNFRFLTFFVYADVSPSTYFDGNFEPRKDEKKENHTYSQNSKSKIDRDKVYSNFDYVSSLAGQLKCVCLFFAKIQVLCAYSLLLLRIFAFSQKHLKSENPIAKKPLDVDAISQACEKASREIPHMVQGSTLNISNLNVLIFHFLDLIEHINEAWVYLCQLEDIESAHKALEVVDKLTTNFTKRRSQVSLNFRGETKFWNFSKLQ